MLSVPIHKDFLTYEPKVIAGLTRRTLVFTVLAVGAGLAVGLIMAFVLKIDPSENYIPIMAISTPFWVLGYMKPHEMKPEVFLLHWIRLNLMPQKIVYRTRRFPGASERMQAKELRDGNVRKEPPRVQRHYAKLRRRRGIEGYQPGDARLSI